MWLARHGASPKASPKPMVVYELLFEDRMDLGQFH